MEELIKAGCRLNIGQGEPPDKVWPNAHFQVRDDGTGHLWLKRRGIWVKMTKELGKKRAGIA